MIRLTLAFMAASLLAVLYRTYDASSLDAALMMALAAVLAFVGGILFMFDRLKG